VVLGDLGRKKSFAKLDGKLGRGLLPDHGRIFPFLGDITQGQINQFGRGFVTGKVASGFEHLSQLHVPTLNGVGGVNDSSDLGRVWPGA
jgi:hypothetical protein